ncbi:MAG: 50S ribosomal protein L21 [Candidatus Omnitrophica bacterium CG1_02_49_10]|nr:MAG: 50S ribosomal protein L21 [Candidatus Omnitrophica bacterium CG1_02_49_10]
MYAIVEVGSKQYKVEKGDFLDVDRMDVKAGKPVSIKKVLLIKDSKDIQVGSPYLKGAHVECEAISDFSGKKVVSLWYRRRKSSKRKVGARHKYTKLLVKEIKNGN